MRQTDIKIQQRNEQIIERFKTLSEEQPLARPYTIIAYLAHEYCLTVQHIARIIKKQRRTSIN